MASRDAHLARIDGGSFDVLIVGGGINGTGIAQPGGQVSGVVDAALVERVDVDDGPPMRAAADRLDVLSRIVPALFAAPSAWRGCRPRRGPG